MVFDRTQNWIRLHKKQIKRDLIIGANVGAIALTGGAFALGELGLIGGAEAVGAATSAAVADTAVAAEGGGEAVSLGTKIIQGGRKALKLAGRVEKKHAKIKEVIGKIHHNIDIIKRQK